MQGKSRKWFCLGLRYQGYRPVALCFTVLLLLVGAKQVLSLPRGADVEIAQATTSLEAARAEAEQLFNEGLQLFRQSTAESLRQAIVKWEEALPLWRAVGDKSQEALTLVAIGFVYDDLGEKQQALDFYNQALPLYREVGDRAGVATTLTNIGTVYSNIGQPTEALNYFNQALPISREVGDRKGEANTLSNLGAVYDDIGQRQKALNYFNQALPIRREVDDRQGEANTLNNMGLVYNNIGQPQQALSYYNQALLISREVGDRKGEANTLSNIGAVYKDIGQPQKALDYLNQALPIDREVSDRSGEAVTLSNLGAVYDDIGQPQQALSYYQKALPIRREVGDRAGEANTLNNIGGVYYDIRQPQQALDYYNQALPIRGEVGDRSGEANTLNNIGVVYYRSGQLQKALEYYEKALPIRREVGDRFGEATTLHNIGKVYDHLEEKQQALSFYNQALSLRRAVGDRGGEAHTLYNLALLKHNQGNLEEALTEIEAAIGIVEDLRTKVASPELRASYFATVQDYYEFYIDLLMQLDRQDPSKGYDARAFHASERARARTLLELLTEANADIRTGVDPKLLQQERRLQNQLDAIEKRRVQLFSGDYSQQQQEAIELERETRLSQYRDIQAQIRATSPRYAALTQPQPLTAAQIQQQVLDQDTLLLQYSLGKERSYLWAVTKDSLTSYELPSRPEISAAVKKFRRVVTDRFATKEELLSASVPLSQMLLSPVAPLLAQKRLLIVGDGILQYVPFATLSIPTRSPEGEQPREYRPLIVEQEIVNLPSSSTLGILREQLSQRQAAPQQLAILADPVFSADDRRVNSQTTAPQKEQTSDLSQLALKRSARQLDVGNWTRLPGTRQEAEAIMALVPESMRASWLKSEVCSF